MSESTSILDLPTDPVGGGNVTNNVTITAQEKLMTQSQQQGGSGMSLDQTTINQIVNGLQQATLVGATQLPSRDIPMTTNNVSIDPQSIPNYVPAPSHNIDYIKNYEQTSDMIKQYNNGKQMNDSLDDIYNEIQAPLLLAVLYFLFQLPFFKRLLYTYIPFLFFNDGNYNINGYLFTSVLFGLLFHLLMKITSYFGAF
jgi:hypothetical protein